MVWIKRNLVFVILLGVAVVLVGVGVTYLLSNKAASDDIEAQLQAKNSELNQLVNRDPHPNEENISQAKRQVEQLNAFKDRAKEYFTPLEVPEGLGNASFKSMLENTIDGLERGAKRSGVSLPEEKYGFTFEEQRRQLQLPESSLAPLATQLLDLRTISEILFDAKVHSLVSLKRAPVGTNETISASYHLARKPLTNSITSSPVAPYEVTFQCFSPELARVLSGLASSPLFIAVKFINVETGSLDSRPGPGMFPQAGLGGPGGMDPMLASRYGLAPPPGANRYGGGPMGPGGGRYAPQPRQFPPPGAPRPGEPVLDDKPIKVTLGLDVIRQPVSVTAAAPDPMMDPGYYPPPAY